MSETASETLGFGPFCTTSLDTVRSCFVFLVSICRDRSSTAGCPPPHQGLGTHRKPPPAREGIEDHIAPHSGSHTKECCNLVITVAEMNSSDVEATIGAIAAPAQPDDSNSATPECSPTARTGKVEIPEAVSEAYRIVQKSTGHVGGNGSFGPIYGEMSIGSMQRVMNFFVEHCEFGADSVFMDVGSGLGKPNIHAACLPEGCKYSIGIECEATRYNLSLVRCPATFPGACSHRVCVRR